jgi:predicted DCC family thiol-disulfide oxidoreductase YuxK
VVVRPNQEPGLISSLGLTRSEVDRASWAVEPGGRRFEGAAGISRVLRELGGGWSVLGSLYLVPPIAWVEDRYYERVARRRAWW